MTEAWLLQISAALDAHAAPVPATRPAQPPDHFLCPITLEIMQTPVIASDNHACERPFTSGHAGLHGLADELLIRSIKLALSLDAYKTVHMRFTGTAPQTHQQACGKQTCRVAADEERALAKWLEDPLNCRSPMTGMPILSTYKRDVALQQIIQAWSKVLLTSTAVSTFHYQHLLLLVERCTHVHLC